MNRTALLLSRKRFSAKPVIWPEFRVHNAIFAMRHVFATAWREAARLMISRERGPPTAATTAFFFYFQINSLYWGGR